ncbi:hypothetical protein SUGI_0868120 [Cryptomeria japonica]|nr:hypothetical protein SUGI_0868120 [Cryptomeria japonica]
MDFNMSSSVISITILSFTVFLSIIFRWARRNNGILALPGPFPLPVIGNLHQLGTLPQRALHRMADKYGPIMLVKFGSIPIVIASSSQAAKQFLKTHDLIFASRPSTAAGKHLFYNRKDILFAPYGAYWRNMRKICVVELLNSKRIESFKGVMEEEALLMVRSIWEKSEQGRVCVDVSHSVACYASDLTWRILTGRTNADRQKGGDLFEKLVMEVTELMGAVNIGDLIPCLEWLDLQGLRRRMKNLHRRLDAVFHKIIDEHAERERRSSVEEEEEEEEERQKDLVDVLLDTETTRDEKKAIILELFVAAIDTSATALEWAMSELLRNPCVMKKLQDEISFVVKKDEEITNSHISTIEYLHCVVLETLRLHPPGRRGCPGALMGIATIEVALGYLNHYFEWRTQEEIDMRESFGATIPRKVHLFAIPTRRSSVNAPSSLRI